MNRNIFSDSQNFSTGGTHKAAAFNELPITGDAWACPGESARKGASCGWRGFDTRRPEGRGLPGGLSSLLLGTLRVFLPFPEPRAISDVRLRRRRSHLHLFL